MNIEVGQTYIIKIRSSIGSFHNSRECIVRVDEVPESGSELFDPICIMIYDPLYVHKQGDVLVLPFHYFIERYDGYQTNQEALRLLRDF